MLDLSDRPDALRVYVLQKPKDEFLDDFGSKVAPYFQA